jgi:hypothetical protein
MRKPKLVIAGVYRALRPRGRFVGELGGHGNVAAIATAMRAVAKARGGDPEHVTQWFFPTVEEYGALLTKNGFTVRETALVPRPTPLPTGIRGWLETFERTTLDRMPPDAREEFLTEIEELLRPEICDRNGGWTAHYVRLRFAATKP